MGRFQLVMLLWKYGKKAADAFGSYPGLENSDNLRAWVAKVLDYLEEAADMTVTETDDAIVDAAQKIVNNDKAWNGFHGLLTVFVNKTDEEIEVLGASEPSAEMVAVAEEAGFSPLLIIAALPYIIQALRMFREWRKNRE